MFWFFLTLLCPKVTTSQSILRTFLIPKIFWQQELFLAQLRSAECKMLHGVLSSLGECSYHGGSFSLHKNSNLNILCTHRTWCTSHCNPKGSQRVNGEGKNVPQTQQLNLEVARRCWSLEGFCTPVTVQVSYWDFQTYQGKLIWAREHQGVAGNMFQDGASRCSPCFPSLAVLEVI